MSDTSNSFISFIAGAAAGAVAGILFAPDKGTETRKKIQTKAEEANSNIRGGIDDSVADLKKYIADFVGEVKDRVDNLESQMAQQAKEAEKAAAAKKK